MIFLDETDPTQQWDSLEKVRAYRDSAAFKDLRPLRNKLGKFRSFVVEGVPQQRIVFTRIALFCRNSIRKSQFIRAREVARPYALNEFGRTP